MQSYKKLRWTNIIMDASNKALRWKEYFEILLNNTTLDNPIPYTTGGIVEIWRKNFRTGFRLSDKIWIEE